MEEVKGVIGIVGQCTIYSEPVAPISMVGINKGWDFLIENAVSGALLRRGSLLFLNCAQNESFLMLSKQAI